MRGPDNRFAYGGIEAAENLTLIAIFATVADDEKAAKGRIH